ncbi:hypothetical protein HDV00_000088 [Rhizophlyctis rosea]|nr:hypothetical protein HDV00_000088 [Rhizophlyctis rosea]
MIEATINRNNTRTYPSISTTTLKHLRRRVARLQNSNPYISPSHSIPKTALKRSGRRPRSMVLAVVPQRKAAVHTVKRNLNASPFATLIDHSATPIPSSTRRLAIASSEPQSITEKPTHFPLYTPPTRKVSHYLFGYGSLINPQSRLRTVPTPTTAIPVVVRGLQRAWSYNCSHSKSAYTAVGVTRVADRSVVTNGVLVPIEQPELELPRLDVRERYYVRELVRLQDVEFWEGGSDALVSAGHDVYVWVYTNPSPSHPTTTPQANIPISTTLNRISHKPCRKSPIPQSYIDCIIAGCMMYGSEFTRQFVCSTLGWDSGVWLNDRHADESVRKYVPNVACGEVDVVDADVVDGLLKEVIPEAFMGRVDA